MTANMYRVGEVPLDLSSTSDKAKENHSDNEKLSENVNTVNSEDSDAVERAVCSCKLCNKSTSAFDT